jgi:hypothetical protein
VGKNRLKKPPGACWQPATSVEGISGCVDGMDEAQARPNEKTYFALLKEKTNN